MELSILNMHLSARNPNRKNAHKGGSGPLMSKEHCFTIETGQPHYVVYIQTNGTNTPTQFTNTTTRSAMTETSEQLKLTKSQNTIYSVVDSLVSHLASLEKEVDLRTPEVLSFLRSLGLHETKDPAIYCLKTSKVCLVTTREKLSRQYLGFSPTWGIELNGRYLTASTLEFPKTGNGCSLSDILEEEVDEKYFLSEEAVEKLKVATIQPREE